MFVQEWIRSNEREVTAEQVKRMEPWTKVTEIRTDRYGECVRQEYTVTQSGKKRVLTARDGSTWERIVKPIRQDPNRRYVVKRT